MTKHPLYRPPVAIPVLVAVLLAGTIAGALLAPPTAQAGPSLQGSTTVAISPAQSEVACGQTAQVEIRVNDVEDLFGVDIKVSFDPNVVEVVDANTTLPGIQIQQGSMPDASGGRGLVQVNAVDAGAGTISYAAVRLNPAQPQSGSGAVASITFRGKAAGTSPLNFVSAVLSDETARPINAEHVGGQIRGTCANPGQTAVPTTPGPTPIPPTPVPGQPTVAPPPPGNTCTHLVRPGHTLYSIARLYGKTVTELMAANGIVNPHLIWAGQTLRIPNCTSPTPGPLPPPTQCQTYVVRPNDTLYSIALRNRDCVVPLAQRNRLANPNLIYAGQTLTVCPGCGGGGGTTPPPPRCRATYVVRPMDTLIWIAFRHNTTVTAIQAANGIANPHLIYAGQVLCIP